MRKILLGTASLLVASTVLFSSIDAQAVMGDALTSTSSDYDLTNVFGPKMTAAGVKAFVLALDREPMAGTPGIKGFAVSPATAGLVTDEGVSIPKTLDVTANKIGGSFTNWNVLNDDTFTARIPLVSVPQTTFTAGQWSQVKMRSCAIGSFSRAYTVSTQDPALFTAVDTFSALTASTSAAYQTYDTGLDAAAAAAVLKDTTFFTTVIPAALDATMAATGGAVSVAASTFNVYIKPAIATFSLSAIPPVQYLEYLISCYGTYQDIS